MRIWTEKSKDRALGHCIREESKKGEDAGKKIQKRGQKCQGKLDGVQESRVFQEVSG